MEIEPFRIDVPDRDVDALRSRLSSTRWAPEIDNDDWSLGVDGTYLHDLVAYWQNDFDWRAQEARMNDFPQYRVVIDDVPIHFLHVRGTGTNPVPIVLTHGWPWTFWDFKDVIMPLADPAAYGGDPEDAFDVVVPSLPGFTYSGPQTRSDVGYVETARLWVELMRGLGYPEFFAHGSDAGAFVTAQLGHAHRESLMGVHLTFPVLPGVSPGAVDPAELSPQDRAIIAGQDRGPAAFYHVLLNASDPQTLAWALHDSPVGQAAWMLRRRHDWSDCHGDVESAFDRDTLLSHFSLYWFSNSFIGSELFCRASEFHRPMQLANDVKPEINVPTAMAALPKDLLYLPRSLVSAHSDLRQWTLLPRGGHFAAAEEPELITADIRSFVRPLRSVSDA